MTHPLLSRSHLEAVLVAHVLLAPALVELVDETRLSAAALTLVAFAADDNTYARASLIAGASDEFSARLVRRVERLTIADLLFHPVDVTVALVNALPALHAAFTANQSAA